MIFNISIKVHSNGYVYIIRIDEINLIHIKAGEGLITKSFAGNFVALSAIMRYFIHLLITSTYFSYEKLIMKGQQ